MIEILIGCFGPKEPAKLSDANYEYNAVLSVSLAFVGTKCLILY